MRVDASFVNLPTLSFSPMSASAGSGRDDLIRDGISRVIDSVKQSNWRQSWKTEPAVLRGLFALEVHIERSDHSEIERHKERIRGLNLNSDFSEV